MNSLGSERLGAWRMDVEDHTMVDDLKLSHDE